MIWSWRKWYFSLIDVIAILTDKGLTSGIENKGQTHGSAPTVGYLFLHVVRLSFTIVPNNGTIKTTKRTKG